MTSNLACPEQDGDYRKNPAFALLRDSAQVTLFVMLRYSIEPSQIAAHIDDHLTWMIQKEKQGSIFLSGPVKGDGPGALTGLTILRASDIAAADALAKEDPFIKRGHVRYELFEWTAFEGRINFSISLSDSMVRLT